MLKPNELLRGAGERPVLTWDESELLCERVQYLRENEGMDELTALQCATDDPDIYDLPMEGLVESLTGIMDCLNPEGWEWACRVSGFGWRGISGHKYFTAENGRELLRAVLPAADCRFRIFLRPIEWAYAYECAEDEYGSVRPSKRVPRQPDEPYLVWSSRTYASEEEAVEAMAAVAGSRSPRPAPVDAELSIQNFHHDSPTGREWYYIRRCPACISCGDRLLSVVDDDFVLGDGTRLVWDGGDIGMVCAGCADAHTWDFCD